MKLLKLSALTLATTLVLGTLTVGTANAAVAVIDKVEGPVVVIRTAADGTKTSTPAAPGMGLEPGDIVRTSTGRVAVNLLTCAGKIGSTSLHGNKKLININGLECVKTISNTGGGYGGIGYVVGGLLALGGVAALASGNDGDSSCVSNC